MDEKEVKSAIREILADKKSYATSLNYAVNYCRMALQMSSSTLQVQCLYILANIHHWRNPRAKEIRRILNAFAKEVIE